MAPNGTQEGMVHVVDLTWYPQPLLVPWWLIMEFFLCDGQRCEFGHPFPIYFAFTYGHTDLCPQLLEKLTMHSCSSQGRGDIKWRHVLKPSPSAINENLLLQLHPPSKLLLDRLISDIAANHLPNLPWLVDRERFQAEDGSQTKSLIWCFPFHCACGWR